MKNLEFIFIDDYSTDNSVKEINQYMKKDKRIKLLKNYKNKGVFHTRYLGAIFSKGIYIYFMDPDDLVYDILEEVYEIAMNDEIDIVEFLYSRYINGKYRKGKKNMGLDYIRKNEEVKYYMFLDSLKDKKYSFSHAFLWDRIVKR